MITSTLSLLQKEWWLPSLLLVPRQLSLAARLSSLFIVYPACALAWWSDFSLSKLSFSGPWTVSMAMASSSHLVQVSDLGVPNLYYYMIIIIIKSDVRLFHFSKTMLLCDDIRLVVIIK